MKKNTGLHVTFIDEQGEGFAGRVEKMSVCGVVIVPDKNSYHFSGSVEGNIVITAQINGEQSVTMAWGKMGERTDTFVELIFDVMDDQSKKNLHKLFREFRNLSSKMAA